MSWGEGGAAIGLSRQTIDVLMRSSALMTRIVTTLVDDAMSVTPTLSGKDGDITDCIEWLSERNFFSAHKRAHYYSWAYGGGGTLCFYDDGRPNDMEVDLAAVRNVVGYYALPKWYLVPVGTGSSRIRSAWYGERIGRPEHYMVTPAGLADPNTAGGIGEVLSAGGSRFHRSRVIPVPYRDDLDLRQAREFSGDMGWGPGAVESCLNPFLARQKGAERLSGIMDSLVVNVLTMPGVQAAMSTPTGGTHGGGIKNMLDWLKSCRDYTAGGVAVLAVDAAAKFETLTHNVAGIDRLIEAQRGYLLDELVYPEVRLFSSGGKSGLSGDADEGQWRAYDQQVKSYQTGPIWTAGSFGGGLKQAVIGAMACRDGPTGGRMDLSVRATWPSYRAANEAERSKTRLADAQARALDRATLTLTPAALLGNDPTVAVAYPSMDLTNNTTPTSTLPGTGALDTTQAAGAPALTPAAAATATAAGAAPPAPLTDAPITDAILEPAPPAPPPMPADIVTEGALAAAMDMTRPAVRRLLEQQKVKPYPMPKGTRGGYRYSQAEVMKAWQRETTDRLDALRSSDGVV